MAVTQLRSRLKASGARYKAARKKKLYELGREPALTKLDKKASVTRRASGGKDKTWLLSANEINLVDPKLKKSVKGVIKTVVDNPANRHFIRRNILTKGTIVETDKGRARITNRPGQEGTLNGVLI